MLTEHTVSYIDYDLNLGDTLLPVTKRQFEYDENNNLVRKFLISWDYENAKWQIYSNIKEEYAYNTANPIKQTKSFMYLDQQDT